ncbi:DUF551 domain-containing protein [Cronobacter malonaticus]
MGTVRRGPCSRIRGSAARAGQAQFQSSEITHWMPLPEAPAKN